MTTSRTTIFIRSISPRTWLEGYNNPNIIEDKIKQRNLAIANLQRLLEEAVQSKDTSLQQTCEIVLGQATREVARLRRRQERAIVKMTRPLHTL